MQVTVRQVIVAMYWVIHDNLYGKHYCISVIVLCFSSFSIECRKSKTKLMTLANYKGHRQSREKISWASNDPFCWEIKEAGVCKSIAMQRKAKHCERINYFLHSSERLSNIWISHCAKSFVCTILFYRRIECRERTNEIRGCVHSKGN